MFHIKLLFRIIYNKPTSVCKLLEAGYISLALYMYICIYKTTIVTGNIFPVQGVPELHQGAGWWGARCAFIGTDWTDPRICRLDIYLLEAIHHRKFSSYTHSVPRISTKGHIYIIYIYIYNYCHFLAPTQMWVPWNALKQGTLYILAQFSRLSIVVQIRTISPSTLISVVNVC